MDLPWTVTPPAAPGFYFFRDPEGVVTVGEVYEDEAAGGDSPACEKVMVLLIGEEESYCPHEIGGEWAGPFTSPA